MATILPIGRDQGDSIVSGLNGIVSALGQGSGGFNTIVPQTTVYPSGTTISYSAVEFAGRQCSVPTVGKTYMLYLNGATQEATATQESAGVTLTFTGMTVVFDNGAMTATLPSHLDSVTFGIAEKVASSGGGSSSGGSSSGGGFHEFEIIPQATISTNSAGSSSFAPYEVTYNGLSGSVAQAAFAQALVDANAIYSAHGGPYDAKLTLDGTVIDCKSIRTGVYNTGTMCEAVILIGDGDIGAANTSGGSNANPLGDTGGTFFLEFYARVENNGYSLSSSVDVNGQFANASTSHTIRAVELVPANYGAFTATERLVASGPTLVDGALAFNVAVSEEFLDSLAYDTMEIDAVVTNSSNYTSLNIKTNVLGIASGGSTTGTKYGGCNLYIGYGPAPIEDDGNGGYIIAFPSIGININSGYDGVSAVFVRFTHVVPIPIMALPHVNYNDGSYYRPSDLLNALNTAFSTIIEAGRNNSWSSLNTITFS